VARPGGSSGRSTGFSVRVKPREGDASLNGKEEPSRADPCREYQVPSLGDTDQALQAGEEEAPTGASDPPGGGPQTEGRPELPSLAENLLGADEAGARLRYHLSFARKVRAEVGTEAKKTPAESYPEEWPLEEIMQLEGPKVEAITMGILWARASDLERAGFPLPLKKLLLILTRPFFEVAESELSALTGKIAGGLRGRAAVWGALPKRVDRTTQTPQNMLLGPPPAGASTAELRFFSRLREGLALLPPPKPCADAEAGETQGPDPGGRSGGKASADPPQPRRKDTPSASVGQRRPRVVRKGGTAGTYVLARPPSRPSLNPVPAGRHTRFGDGRAVTEVVGGGGRDRSSSKVSLQLEVPSNQDWS